MTEAYFVVESFEFYQVQGNTQMTKLARTLVGERKSFKVAVCPLEGSGCTKITAYYKPVYDHVYLYPLKNHSEFKEIALTGNSQMVWHRVDGKSEQMITPPWLDEDDVEFTHNELLISAVKTISRLKLKEKEDFCNRTYVKAPDVGSIDSIEQFTQRFPNDNPEAFNFILTGSQNLIAKYGNYQRWWKSGYDVKYYGNADVHSDDDGFSVFPVKFYEFHRKPPEEDDAEEEEEEGEEEEEESIYREALSDGPL